MGRNKKDATQDVLNLYNQMQEDENIESGKDEIKVTLEEIESAKEVLNKAKEELDNAYQKLESTRIALVAAQESTDNIVGGVCNAIVKAERNTIIHAKVDDSELAKVNQCSAKHIKAEKKLLEEHSKELAKHLQKNEGIWLSSGWLRFTIVILTICCIAVVLWTCLKN